MNRRTLHDIAFYVVMVIVLLVAVAVGSIFVRIAWLLWTDQTQPFGNYTMTIQQHYSASKEDE
ncbi:hypothetical protein [Burkholderia vietnamiensis]|uniref:hypothetical protein n=1 Tax=Burkholderia vietnamiensis TaxID=60552 RepID=UPI001CAD2922|nr:hypothetical protein [Burkholderia vietnamiensis]CAG9229234.1 hypothetical protein BVI1335_70175 [Burkholderia vietnamiensis]HDR9086297.1 hypothetical protein [Burkholderia vietnamiensis]